ncbi:MAG: O-antigen ligase family protein [Bacteroidales bacterium]|nr:O-antigen ligase family protein [Bacteroidales bacterium]
MTTSNYLMNMAWVFLAANWLLEWDMRHKFANFKTNYLLQAWLVLFLLHVVGLLWSSNIAYGLDDLRKKLPLLFIPLVVLTSQPLSDKRYRWVLFSYIMAMLVASIIGLVRFFTIPDLPYRDIIPFISHIRFSLNLCLGIMLLGWQIIRARSFQTRLWASLLATYFFLYLFLLQSYTGCIILFVLALVMLCHYWKTIENRRLRGAMLTLWCLVFISVGTLVGFHIHQYYHLIPQAKAPLAMQTANGRPYTHQQDGLIENGNYVNNYINDEEMWHEWRKRNNRDLYDTSATGYPIRGALVRYLNAKGLTKDSAGMAQLNNNEIDAIAKGIANPVYEKHLSIQRMVYVLCFEYENYRCFNSVRNFTMLQRFELWKNGWSVFLHSPLIGVGTGDVVDMCHKELIKSQSDLAGTKKHTHNQYLTFLITFGLLGFIIIVWMFVRAFRRQHLLRIAPFLIITTITLISFITEDTLETLAGAMFVTLFSTLFASHRLKNNES